MAAKRINSEKNLKNAVAQAAEALAEGGVVVFPTETVYGIGVISGNAKALARLRELKNREADKPFQYLASGLDMAKSIGGVFSPKTVKLARNYWPGPLTLVVPDGTGSGSTLGIRVPDSPFVLALLRVLGRPIISSSANPAGQPPPLDADAADLFGTAVDLLIDGGPVIDGVPSSVVRCVEGEFEIVREGGINAEAVRAAWEE